jgi:hypothetical protein
MDKRPTEVFATALASLGLLKITESNAATYIGSIDHRNNKRYSNSELADAFLVKGKPSYMGDIITMFDKRLYKSWTNCQYHQKQINRLPKRKEAMPKLYSINLDSLSQLNKYKIYSCNVWY